MCSIILLMCISSYLRQLWHTISLCIGIALALPRPTTITTIISHLALILFLLFTQLAHRLLPGSDFFYSITQFQAQSLCSLTSAHTYRHPHAAFDMCLDQVWRSKSTPHRGQHTWMSHILLYSN